MRCSFSKINLLKLIVLACCNVANAQINPAQLQQYLQSNKFRQLNKIKYPADIKTFYARLNFKTAWIEKENRPALTILLKNLQSSPLKGLSIKDYQFTFIEAYQSGLQQLKTLDDSLETDTRITDVAIHYYNDIAFGNTKPVFSYNGLQYTPSCNNIPYLMADYISSNSLLQLAPVLSPPLPEILVMERKINWLQTLTSNTGFAEIKITSNKISSSNKPLLAKLYHLGIIDAPGENDIDSITLKQKIKDAQIQFNLVADGRLNAALLKALNVPVAVRLQQLSLGINYYRWLYCLSKVESVIVVNIPAAYMKVYNNKEVILEMKMIVGKRKTTTPTLTSRVTEVILYPYWHVPYSITTKELLPRIKRNAGYIDENNYQVLNKSGKIVNPYSVNWHELSRSYFPYIIRQSTGCDNALGLIKLNFYNPLGVYLHDTPTKNLFSSNSRYFSHGCMRMDKPMELGHLILKNNAIAIDTLEQKGCLQNLSPITVPADVHMPVVVWYNPVGIDAEGRLMFFEDVYGKFNWAIKQ